MARVDSLDILLDPSGKMLLAEAYDGVIENVQKSAVSAQIKNTDLSGDPTTGSVEAKRFANAEVGDYGDARTAGKGDAVKGKPVTIKINDDKELVEELEQKDVSLLGVEGLVAKRSANHAKRMEAYLDTKFFSVAKTAGTQYKAPKDSTTTVVEDIEASIVALESLKNDYIDGIDRSMISVTVTPAVYSAIRTHLDTIHNPNVDSAAGDFVAFHGVRVFSSNRLPQNVKFITMMDGSVAQAVITNEYVAEKIPLSNAYGLALFFSNGTEAVTPETILWNDGTKATA